MWNVPLFSVKTSFANNAGKGKKLNRGGGSSPSCFSQRSKLIERRLMRHGVPVLKRPMAKPSSFKDSLNPELVSAMRPPGFEFSPTCSKPRRNVPEVTTTARPAMARPTSVSTPLHSPGCVRADLRNGGLFKIQAWRALEHSLHAKLVGLLIALRSGGPDAWAFGAIKHAKLQARRVGI